jgi:DNA-binding Lrp family transcriptional regulator
MPTLPPPPAVKLTPAEAAAIAKRGRKLMRAGRVTHCQWAVLDCLLWSCRSPTTGAIVVSFSGLQRLANVSRATVSSAIQALEKLKVLRRIKRRVRCLWHQGGQQSRQATNAYVLHPLRHSEFNSRTVYQSDKVELLYVQQQTPADAAATAAALAQRRKVMRERLLTTRGRWSLGAT